VTRHDGLAGACCWSARVSRAAGLALLALSVAGCDEMRKWPGWGGRPAEVVREEEEAPSESTPAPPRQGKVRFNVLRIEAPEGELEQATDLWQHVGATGLSPVEAEALRENGFRVGVGLDEAREPLRRRLASLEGVRSKLEQVLPNMERSVEMFIMEAERDWTVFVMGADGKMSGQTFDDARAVIRFTWSVDPGGTDRVALRVVPEIRQAPGQVRIQRIDERWQYRPEYRGRVFEELAFEVAIPKAGFLMLGPTMEATQRPLLARPFFVEPASGRQRESLYIISPIVEWLASPTTQGVVELSRRGPPRESGSARE
jgi:hypothetical protein